MTEEKKNEGKIKEKIIKKREVDTTTSVKDISEKNVANVKDAKNGKEQPIEKQSKKKKGKRMVFKGQAHIKCTYNNTVITITDMNGATLGWSSAGLLGFKGAKKSTPFAATKVAADVSEKVKKFGLKELMIFIKGVGGGRESTVRGLAGAGFDILLIKDVTPVPHNGCRRRRPRRV